MPRPQDPSIDAFDFARTAAHCEGEVALARLPRLSEMLTASEGALRYRVHGHIDAEGNPGATMHLAATLLLTCQRCNQPLQFELEQTTLFRFVHDEQQLNSVPIEQDDVDLIVGSHEMPVLPWIEDEAILSLPLVPRHADCRPTIPSEAPPAADPPHPFAALADLISEAKSPPSAGDHESETAENDEQKRN